MKILILLFLLSSVSPVWGAISKGTASSATGTTQNLSWSHTMESGANGLLVVGCSWQSGATTVSGITYNSAALTQVPSAKGCESDRCVDAWYKKAPSSGSNTVDVTLVADINSLVCGALGWTGVDQTTPLGAASLGVGVASSSTRTVTVAAGEYLMDVIAVSTDTTSLTPNRTQEWNVKEPVALNVWGGAQTTATTGSVAMTWTFSIGSNFAHVAFLVLPAASAFPTYYYQQLSQQ